MVRSLLKKGSLLALSVLFTFTLLASSLSSLFTNSGVASATSSCDKVNIVYCGISGTDLSSEIASFKSRYNSNNSGHSASPSVRTDYHDLQAVYNWAGASQTIVDGMNDSNTQLGTLYKDGSIVVGGTKVATGAWVTARFSEGSGFHKVEGNVYERLTTTSFAEESAPVLVYAPNGDFKFAVMTGCGNAIKATPIPKPTPAELTCDELVFNSASKTDDKAFTFTATASAKNTTIESYTFTFDDGASKTVATNASQAKADHTFTSVGNHKANVSVSSKDKKNVTSEACSVALSIAQPQPVLTCNELLFTNNNDDYSFTAKASATNTTITGYSFDFGDGATQTVATSNTSATATHTYAPGTSTSAFVTVSSTDKKDITSEKCAVQINIPQVMCTIPGLTNLPANSPQCVETPNLNCNELLFSQNGDNTLSYSFVVKSDQKNVTITGYSVDFGDNTPQYNGAAPAVNHTYATAGTYNVTASVTGATNDGKTITSAKCTAKVAITPAMCTVPGKANLPANSPQCVETPPTPPVTPVTPTTPTALPNTGPGSVLGLFTGVAIAGAAFYRLYSSRRLFSFGR